MKFTWFNLMPWPYMPDDFRQKHRSVWVDIDQRLFDPIAVVEILGVPQIDDQVTARIGQPILCNEVILAVLIPRGNRNRDGPRRSAHFVMPCSIDRRHTESELSHPGTYPLRALTPDAFHLTDRGTAKTKAAGGRENLRRAALLRRRNKANIGPPPPHARNFGASG